MHKLIYMAGPDVFLPNAREIAQKKKALAQSYGFLGLHPFDNEVEVPQTPCRATALKIAQENVKLMQQADAIIANLTPFRGASADVGTCFELGYMMALKKPAYAYSNVSDTYAQRLRTLERGVHASMDGALFDSKGMRVENFDLFDNLMLGLLHVDNKPRIVFCQSSERDRYSCLKGFERALALMASD
jgi:nucleoside 2-deoxyribosyltransferase